MPRPLPVAGQTVAVLTLAWAVSGCFNGDGKGASLDPDEFIATAGLPDGLRLELAASEPAVVDPVGLTFDADGRMYVVEMGDYPTRPEGSPPLGRVKLLVDEDLDGSYETWTLFADGLQYPTSVLPWRDGILVTQPPDILFLRDDDGDGSADTREPLFSGFPVANTQHNINGLTWGLDNWVYAANGGNHGGGHPSGAPDAVVSIRGMDFRFQPDTGALETSHETTGGHGIAFDAWGRMFGTHNLNHVQHMVFPAAYLARNPLLAVPTTRHMISNHGGSAQLFQLSDAETRVNHPEQSGRFSGGSGIAFYGGGTLGAAYDARLFVNDVVVNVVHQDVLTADGPSFAATRRAEGVELLAGRDNWFRPVTLATGPEGALYVVDMHRAVIEHPEWIPDAVEATLDVRAGDDKGRIYRIVPREGLPTVRPDPAGWQTRVADAREAGGGAYDALLEARARELGHELAEAVRQIVNGPLQDVTGPITSSIEVVGLPLAPPISREEALAMAEQFPPDVGFVHYPNRYRGTNWVRMLLRYYENGIPFPTTTTEMICTDDTYLIHETDEEFLARYDDRIHDASPCIYNEVIVARLGPMPIVAMQGEICAPIGARIKDVFRADMPIMVFGYMGEHNLYIPTRELVRLNAYQAQVIQIQYASPVGWAPEVEDEMVAHVVRMVAGILE